MFQRLMTVVVALCMALLVQAPIVSNCPAFADSPPELNKDTDPKILRDRIKLMDKLIREKGPKANFYFNKGLYLSWLKEHESSIYNFSKALKLNPKDGEAYCFRAYSLRITKKLSESESDYSKAIECGYRKANVFSGRALVYVALGKYRKAIDDAKKAIRMNPTNEDAWLARGISELRLGKANESIVSLSKAIRLNPKHAYSYACRHDAYKNIGDNEKAAKDRKLFLKYSKKY